MPTTSAYGDGVSAWRLISEELRREILDGHRPACSRLPAEADLAQRFGVHRNTVRRAIAVLADDGLVTSRRGSGTYVTEQRVVVHRIGTRTRLSRSLGSAGSRARGELLTSEVATPPVDIATRLGLDDRPALHLETIRRVDGSPVATATHWIEATRTADLPEHFRASGSITESLRACGIEDYVRTSTVVGARIATSTEAARLEVPGGSVLLVVRALDSLPDGTPLQVVVTLFRADRIELDVEHVGA